MKINGGAPSQRGTDQPAERYAKNAAKESHSAGFRKEKAAHVAVGCAKRFQYADFAAAFGDGPRGRLTRRPAERHGVALRSSAEGILARHRTRRSLPKDPTR